MCDDWLLPSRLSLVAHWSLVGKCLALGIRPILQHSHLPRQLAGQDLGLPGLTCSIPDTGHPLARMEVEEEPLLPLVRNRRSKTAARSASPLFQPLICLHFIPRMSKLVKPEGSSVLTGKERRREEQEGGGSRLRQKEGGSRLSQEGVWSRLGQEGGGSRMVSPEVALRQAGRNRMGASQYYVIMAEVLEGLVAGFIKWCWCTVVVVMVGDVVVDGLLVKM